MKCREVQHQLYLYRPGELTTERREAVERHLAVCPDCAARRDAVLELEKRISEIRGMEPRIEDPAGLTSAVMRATLEAERPAARTSRVLFDWSVSPAFRVAACLILFLLSGLFFAQTAVDARKVTALEYRLKSERVSSGAHWPVAARKAGLSPPALDLLALPAHVRNHAAGYLNGNTNEPDLTAVLGLLFGQQRSEGTALFEYLATRYPRLASVRIDDGIDAREQEILFSDGEACMEEISQVIHKTGVRHDRP